MSSVFKHLENEKKNDRIIMLIGSKLHLQSIKNWQSKVQPTIFLKKNKVRNPFVYEKILVFHFNFNTTVLHNLQIYMYKYSLIFTQNILTV